MLRGPHKNNNFKIHCLGCWCTLGNLAAAGADPHCNYQMAVREGFFADKRLETKAICMPWWVEITVIYEDITWKTRHHLNDLLFSPSKL